jgi:hypothetical protein
MFTRKPRLQPGKFLNSGAKRLLQHNLATTGLMHCNKQRARLQ